MSMNRNLELFKIYVVQHLGEAGLADIWVSELNTYCSIARPHLSYSKINLTTFTIYCALLHIVLYDVIYVTYNTHIFHYILCQFLHGKTEPSMCCLVSLYTFILFMT